MRTILAVILGIAATELAYAGDPCAHQSLLPAYSHNDYRNAQPLHDALALGYRGVEADLLRVDEVLLVGHERGELDPTRTFAHLYLDPLFEQLHNCGYILPDATSFLLNIELKEKDEHAFRLLLDELERYPELFQPQDANVVPAVRPVLVGWWPASRQPWPEYLGIQLVVRDSGTAQADAAGLPVALITIPYGRRFTMAGRGGIPATSLTMLAEGRRLAAAYGAPLRVHHAPESPRVYRWLLSEGVTLIGTTDLTRTRTLLLDIPETSP
ncbi:MAG: hypothetical protein OEX18_10910 [Candidatus Krumholzibacteria bacterium]|nr:hypothetical protein [Candidatus Krumholzibacteria bacterium]MDH4337769.1 hypothetical protein [Candidatus Krumholzibacteria bacterium]MDH5271168.1 hypothetical protein [Candidatus Krumholzibacteria bacterium]